MGNSCSDCAKYNNCHSGGFAVCEDFRPGVPPEEAEYNQQLKEFRDWRNRHTELVPDVTGLKKQQRFY